MYPVAGSNNVPGGLSAQLPCRVSALDRCATTAIRSVRKGSIFLACGHFPRPPISCLARVFIDLLALVQAARLYWFEAGDLFFQISERDLHLIGFFCYGY